VNTTELKTINNWRLLYGDSQIVLLDGFHAIKHALRFGARIPIAVTLDLNAVIELCESLSRDLTKTLDRLVTEIPRETYRKLVPSVHPTGVAALAYRPDTTSARKQLDSSARVAPIVALDDPRNLGNIGAVIRLVAGMEGGGVITIGQTDPWHPHVMRGSAGLHFAVPVIQEQIESLPLAPLYAFDAEGVDIREMRIPNKAILVFGSERHGISPSIRQRSDVIISLPIRPMVSSYNLATSVAMALFHWKCQKS
jgi:TrmH family RNA methyltransferase